MSGAEEEMTAIKEPAFKPVPEATPVHIPAVSHNLNGQKLGRKGRDTRERILAAAATLLIEPDEAPFTMGEIARRSSLGMTSLYNYFADLTELLLAVLEPVMVTAEADYLHLLRSYWPDEELSERCGEFVLAYHNFWARHTRLLHLRNAMSDQFDERIFQQRIESTQPIIQLLIAQMTRHGSRPPPEAPQMASMTMIGVERAITISTDDRMAALFGWEPNTDRHRFILPGSRMMELAIRDMRDRAE
jgi:AcrR family transcriptional regulator